MAVSFLRIRVIQNQRRSVVHAGGQLAVEHIQALGIGAEQLHLGDQIVGVSLLLALLLYEPIQELHGTEILHLVGSGIDVIDQGSHILLMFQSSLQRVHVAGEYLVGLGNGVQGDRLVVVVQILIKQQGVVPLLLGLDLIPVGKAVQSPGLVVIGKVQIQISRVKFLVHLLVQQLLHFGVQHHLILLVSISVFLILILPRTFPNRSCKYHNMQILE